MPGPVLGHVYLSGFSSERAGSGGVKVRSASMLKMSFMPLIHGKLIPKHYLIETSKSHKCKVNMP